MQKINFSLCSAWQNAREPFQWGTMPPSIPCFQKAAVLVLAADISERSKRNMRITAQKHFADLLVAEPDITIDEIYSACGYKAGILTVNNAEMGKRIVTLINE